MNISMTLIGRFFGIYYIFFTQKYDQNAIGWTVQVAIS